jgi:hypothetical protein
MEIFTSNAGIPGPFRSPSESAGGFSVKSAIGWEFDPTSDAQQPSEAPPIAEFSEIAGLLRAYYRNQTVHERMREFLGAVDPQKPTAVYIVGNDGFSDFGEPSSPARLSEYLGDGLEIDRSLWDQDSLIADIDLEYHNFDYPAAPWLDPERAFKLQEPVLDVTLRILRQYGVVPLTLVSGRGFHLVWAVSRNSRAFRRLVGLGRVPPSLQARYAHPCPPSGLSVDPDLGHAFAGLGLILEFVWHRVLRASEHSCTLPVQPTAIEVGPGIGGREIISFDLSEYGDPLHTRRIRLPFSAYLKPRQFEWMLGQAGVRRLLPIFAIPLQGITLREAIDVARNPNLALELSQHCSVHIPDRSGPMQSLIDEYEASELAAFHKEFYAQPWEQDPLHPLCTRIPDAPRCMEWLLEHPNDWLLKPAALQHVARILTALECRPRAIAQLICARYKRDCNWGDLWLRLDPLNRAIFYTRLFAGMIATGCDKLIDLNCVSHKEKGYCMIPECCSNLVTYRETLLKRRLR